MIKLENCEVIGWEHAIRGMRNPMNSWDRSDSEEFEIRNFRSNGHVEPYVVGVNDLELMLKLAKAGSVHAKYRRMITVYVDITAPLYFWKEFDTYKVGTVANSCSTMHRIHEKMLVLDDFSHEHLITEKETQWGDICPTLTLECTITALNSYRKKFLETNDKKYWWQMIQLLPSSYNQKRTVMLNYEVLANIYEYRRNHKLDEWRDFCRWIETLPYSEIITCGVKEE